MGVLSSPRPSTGSPALRSPSLREAAVAAAVAVLMATLAACSSGGGGSTTGTPNPDDLVAVVASFDVAVGPPARFLVGLLTADQRSVVYGGVEERFSFLGTKDAPIEAPVAGPPVPATFLPIPGTDAPPAGAATPQVVTGSVARGVYSATAAFDRPGFWQVEVAAEVAGKTRRATAAFGVEERHAVPFVGDPAPASENLTMASTDAPRAAIDSRGGGSGDIPDPELHSTTVAASLAAKRPVVVAVSTPVYCTSRFCGPVTDMVQELSHTYGDRASFVHIEVFKDFQADPQVFNRAAVEWIHPSGVGDINEPWVFVVGADGRIVARFDNVTTRGELEPVLQQLPVIGPPPA